MAIFSNGFGFSRSQREHDAWEVKAYQDKLLTASHHTQIPADGDVNDHIIDAQRKEEKAELGGRRQHWRAFALAIAAYNGIILFGYDTGLGGGVVSQPVFLSDMGIKGDKLHIANVKSNIVAILQGGSFFGALGAAPINNKIGRKYSILLGCVIFTVGGVLQTAGRSLNYQYAGRFLAGVGVGIQSSVCPTFVSEIAPTHLRGNLTGLFQVCVVIGVALSYWINYGTSFMPATNSARWQIPVGMQLVWVVPMFIIIPFIKESPRWLVSKDRNTEALANLAWVRGRTVDDYRVQTEFASIVAAVDSEKEATAGATWTKEITRPGQPKRFFIAGLLFICQQWSGQNSINYYAPDIFASIGITGTKGSLLASGVYGLVKIVATVIFMVFGVERAGRKKYFTFGALGMGTFLLMIGAIFTTHPPKATATSVSGASIGMAVLIYLFVIPYCFSWGGLVWVYISEIFDTRSRAYGIAFANSMQWLNNFAVTKSTPLMVLALKNGGLFYFFGAINFLNFFVSLWIPETRGLSLEQMDVVFGAISKEDRIAAIENKAREAHLDMGDASSEVDVEKFNANIEHRERAR